LEIAMLVARNRLIDSGVILIVASVLVWIGAELTRRVEWLLPYIGGAGIALVVVGALFEWWRVGRRVLPQK
jgi:hypothetical protein